MPSDERLAPALEAVSDSCERFRSSIALTIEEVRGLLASRTSTTAERGDRLAEELGAFAAGRIDPARLAGVLLEPHKVGAGEVSQIERALEVLVSMQRSGEELFTSTLDRGDSLVDHVDREFARLGSAFGAARVVELVRDGLYRGGERNALEGFRFARWNLAERAIAPPLLVTLDGADLQPGGLDRFLDGGCQLVLLVRGETPAASLVRLISPRVVVIQTDDVAELSLLADQQGPVLAALVPVGLPRFTHRPAPGPGLGVLTVEGLPEEAPDRPIDDISVFRQREDLDQLRLLAAASTASGVVPEDGTGADGEAAALDPAATLAAWLLDQADVSDLTPPAG
ncbi:MAG: hypothetical protein OEU54_15795 [Gemmatimonadota bacterium]|nr:hypothetical protein [Gemmatimonadota bacterium]